jgi:hypothetical protein
MSGSIDIASSRLRAIDRIITVMQATYPQALEAYKQIPDLDIGDLYLPPPHLEAYYYQPFPIGEMPINRDPFVVVFPSDARRLQSRASSGPTGQTEWREFQVTVVLVFKATGGNTFQRLNKTMTSHDTHWLRAEAYTGAMAHVIEEYACEPSSIHKIELLDDMSEIVMPESRKYMGVSQTVWNVKQLVMMPRRRRLPEPNNGE